MKEADKKERCHYTEDRGGQLFFCSEGKLWRDAGGFGRECDETCPRCGGTGFVPFPSWDEISDDAREGRRASARYINEEAIKPIEDAWRIARTILGEGAPAETWDAVDFLDKMIDNEDET
jgi:hypothetical protein